MNRSFENQNHGDNAFSIRKTAAPLDLFSIDVKNVSLAVYRGKLRAAVAYDSWRGGDKTPGWAFMPLADGIFHASLRDLNDVEKIAEKMSTSARGQGLFWRMNAAEKSTVFQANNMPVAASILLLTLP